MQTIFQQIYQQVWQELFPNQEIMPLETFQKLYTSDISLPKLYTCELSGQEVFSSDEYGYKRFITPETSIQRGEKDNHMESKKTIDSLYNLLETSKNVFLFKGSRSVNSDGLEASDDIYSSSYVYNSTHLYSCQKMLFSYNCVESEYLIASKGSKACSFGIRVFDSGSASNCFDVSFIGKSANCYFCHDSYDLRDCMFCFHLTSKQYCIGNMQFDKDEYEKLKRLLLKDYFAQLDGPNSFITLRDL